MLEYGFRQAIRDEVLAAVREQKNLYDSMAAAIERRMSPIIEEEVRNHFLRRLDQSSPRNGTKSSCDYSSPSQRLKRSLRPLTRTGATCGRFGTG